LDYACHDHDTSPAFEEIEKQRKLLLQSKKPILKMDKGAGSLSNTGQETTISKIARSALSKPYQCRFMSRIIHQSRARNILELGTSLGISTCYLAAGSPEGNVTTIEADPTIAGYAKKTFQQLGYNQIHIHQSTFEEFFQAFGGEARLYDFIFIDGHHRSAALWQYYSALRPSCHPHTIIIVDDIYWSPEMHLGWKRLIALPEITQSVDCFHFGILFFNPDFLEKKNHLVRLPLRSLA
jgi:predicted O-methyltransferase YrrM